MSADACRVKSAAMDNRVVKSITGVLVIPAAHFLAAVLWPSFVKIQIPHLLLIYGILGALTVLHLFVVRIVAQRHRQQAAMIVMALNMLKMLLSVILLFVVVVPFTGKSGAVGVNFAVAYVFYLVFDSQIVILLLNGRK